jgi:hypothetical protein
MVLRRLKMMIQLQLCVLEWASEITIIKTLPTRITILRRFICLTRLGSTHMVVVTSYGDSSMLYNVGIYIQLPFYVLQVISPMDSFKKKRLLKRKGEYTNFGLICLSSHEWDFVLGSGEVFEELYFR